MDQDALAIVSADLEGQMALIDEIYAKLERRAAGLHAENDMQLESVAYQLHEGGEAIWLLASAADTVRRIDRALP